MPACLFLCLRLSWEWGTNLHLPTGHSPRALASGGMGIETAGATPDIHPREKKKKERIVILGVNVRLSHRRLLLFCVKLTSLPPTGSARRGSLVLDVSQMRTIGTCTCYTLRYDLTNIG